MSKLVFGLIGALVLAWTLLVGPQAWVNAHRLAPAPHNESPLYQHYDPEAVISKFRYPGENYGRGGGYGSANLVKSIHHTKTFTPGFTIEVNREPALLNALHEDIAQSLKTPGVSVTAMQDDPDGGFTYRYTSANSVGSISVQPPSRQNILRGAPLPSGVNDVEVLIAMDETWTRPPNETQWWMAAVN